MAHSRKVSVVGLGYVGLPVAVAFGQKDRVIGFDVNDKRVESLKSGQDWTHEISSQDLSTSDIYFTANSQDLKDADFHIIAVPTPVDEAHKPDLTALEKASEGIGKILKKGDIVVYESTVFPGATEEVCIPILEQFSKLKAGEDFTVGYSPERINPGDKEHRFSNITKVVSGQDQETLDIIAEVYSSVIDAGVHKASTIKVAEAAKVIENTQRDLNIALMNELALIFDKMDIDTSEVLEAASTKWNFLPFTPGLVGGHCIGVDPYYLTFKAKQLGYRPEVILAGRRINDNMSKYVAQQTIKQMIQAGCMIKNSSVAVLGLTFKEDCPDLRNSKVIDVIRELESFGVKVLVHDPLADPKDAKSLYDIDLCAWDEIKDVDAVVMCVAHQHYLELNPEAFLSKLNGHQLVFDVKSKLDKKRFNDNKIQLWRL